MKLRVPWLPSARASAALPLAIVSLSIRPSPAANATTACAATINLCDNREVVGVSCGDYRRNGAFAEYVSVPRRIVYPLPAGLPFAEAAMLEAISVAMHAVRVSGAAAGEHGTGDRRRHDRAAHMQALRVAGWGRY